MEYIEGHAVFTPEGNVKVGDEVLSAKHILIATGGYPIVPSLPGENIFFLFLLIIIVIIK